MMIIKPNIKRKYNYKQVGIVFTIVFIFVIINQQINL